jgi:hypothetical protein
MNDSELHDPEDLRAGGDLIAGDKIGGDSVGQNKIGGDSVGQNKIVGLSGEDVTKIIEVLLKHFPEMYLREPEHLDEVLQSFHRCHEELHEWKELHNYLDTTVQLYDQFAEAVRNVDRQSFNSESLHNLQNSWYKISLMLDQMLTWAKRIQLIGKPYQETNDGKLIGEDWAIKLELTRRDIECHLNIAHDCIEASAVRPLYKKLFNPAQLGERWFIQLMDYTSRYWSLALSYLHFTDDKLRTTATRLVDISQAALRR